ncbi:MAG: zinc-dependent metalloprotease [Chitinophagaceae bacterium]|nr:zinc-dependent metalloprotease [Chitinophagaceae bacterium]
MKNLLIAILAGMLMSTGNSYAQNTICGNELIQQYIDNDPVLKAQDQENWTKYVERNKQLKNTANKNTGDVTIPVVFHVILNSSQMAAVNDTAGIIERVFSQIAVLNEDFNAKNFDIQNVPEVFKPYVGNPNMGFGVAKIDPNGKARLGIEFLVKDGGFDGYSGHDAATKRKVSGGLDPWDNTRYLNVWITNLKNSGTGSQLLGYAFSPQYAQNVYGDPQLGGAVVHYLALGRRSSTITNFFSPTVDKGRTLTHELGHFFNIWHIWGNTQIGSGNCFDDDGIDDTPRQEDANQSCQFGTFVPIPNCSNGSHPGGEMFMNYMDYSGDRCQNMFTADQVAVMRKELEPGGISHGLSLHPELCFWPAGVSAVEYNNHLEIGPNPSTGIFNIRFVEKYNRLDKISVVSTMGQTVKEVTVESQQNGYSIDMTSMPKGMYIVHLHFDEGIISKKVVLQ